MTLEASLGLCLHLNSGSRASLLRFFSGFFNTFNTQIVDDAVLQYHFSPKLTLSGLMTFHLGPLTLIKVGLNLHLVLEVVLEM